MSIVWVADWLGGGWTLFLMALSFISGIFMLRHTGISGLLLAGAAVRSGQTFPSIRCCGRFAILPPRFSCSAPVLFQPPLPYSCWFRLKAMRPFLQRSLSKAARLTAPPKMMKTLSKANIRLRAPAKPTNRKTISNTNPIDDFLHNRPSEIGIPQKCFIFQTALVLSGLWKCKYRFVIRLFRINHLK